MTRYFIIIFREPQHGVNLKTIVTAVQGIPPPCFSVLTITLGHGDTELIYNLILPTLCI